MGKTTALPHTASMPVVMLRPTQHPWDKPLLQRWQQIKDDLGDLELFGEKTKSSTATIWRRMGREGEK